MKKWFVNNYKLIKLNGILLLTFAFFVILQLFSSCSAVTESELTEHGFTVSEWASAVLAYYDVLENDYLYFVIKYEENDVVNYTIKVIPAYTSNVTTLFAEIYSTTSTGDNCINILPKITNITEFSLDNLYLNNTKGLNIFTLDYNFANLQYTSSSEYQLGDKNGRMSNVFLDRSNYVIPKFAYIGKFRVDEVTLLSNILYTNADNYIQRGYLSPGYNYYLPAQIHDFDRDLVVYDYGLYVGYGEDNFGKYLTLDADLKATNCTTIIFKGNDVMNKTSYSASTLMDFDMLKVYYTGDVEVTFYDVNNNVLQTMNVVDYSSGGELLQNEIDVIFDVSNSTPNEYERLFYYDFIDMYFTFNNVNNYENDVDSGNDLYYPCYRYKIKFKDGHTLSSKTYYYDWDYSYYLRFHSCIPEFLSGDEIADNVFLNAVASYYYVANDLYEYITKNKILFDVEVEFFVGQFSNSGNGNMQYKNTVTSKSYTISFNYVDYGTNIVQQITDIDSNGNTVKIGYIVVDSNGNIIKASLVEGYSVVDNTVVNSDNDVKYTTGTDIDGNIVVYDSSGNTYGTHEVPDFAERFEQHDKDVDNSMISTFTKGLETVIETITSTIGLLLGSTARNSSIVWTSI